MKGKPWRPDWRRFCDMLVPMRERYLEEVNDQISALLADPNKTPTEKFWEARKEIEEQVKTLRFCLDDYRPSNMLFKMSEMCRSGMMKRDDLEGFSPDLVEQLEDCFKPRSRQRNRIK